MKKIGLYPGTFNPIHNGHITLANYFINNTELDEVWVVITPQNPFKKNNDLIEDDYRLEMANKTFNHLKNIKVSDIEFQLEKPNYTIDTINKLSEEFPDNQFTLIIGEDNLTNFHQWKDYTKILDLVNVFVYPRIKKHDVDLEIANDVRIQILNAPKIQISSEKIRKEMKEGDDVKSYLPKDVYQYIIEKKLYQ
ncbi:MAG: nicotinate (nicotinamide) nucleotide adenylyltransferase [Bacteroidota bacterium]|nr:nicotinate (nicotinamide) nucleotide adenylyltransferase [Bacteroidota bacterium]MED5269252.1 nicotinate (nicotinamide) nucleotide adenylyltransferase [Bacteroidota bacterium]